MTNSMIEYNWNSLGEGSLNEGRKEVRGKERGGITWDGRLLE